MLLRVQLAGWEGSRSLRRLPGFGLGQLGGRGPCGERGKAGGRGLSGDSVGKSQVSLQGYDSFQISMQV